ncbi:sensor histidine kinase [Myroides guanonis]|nr:ATP-binding protein [Myroides guanonis]
MFKKLSIKNRIALIYSFSFTVILGLIFGVLFFVVKNGVNQVMYETLNEEINSHVNFVLHEPIFKSYVPEREWEEVEHTDLALNPVFIAIYDNDFNLVEHSPNLVDPKFQWKKNQAENTPYYTEVNSIKMLMSQAQLIHHGEKVGYVIVALSTKHNQLALEYLETSLMFIFPIAVLLIFIVARYSASNSIRPVFKIIDTAQKITETNLNERIPLPKNKDELFQLSKTINDLLDRLELQIIKAKQFSADASHELRTPLSIIKGTLEVLIRRERKQEEYQDKIQYTLQQVDRLYQLVEQFLLLSRTENNSIKIFKSTFDLKEEITNCLVRFDFLIKEKSIKIVLEGLQPMLANNSKEYLGIIIDNILSNAIKYTPIHGSIIISCYLKNNKYHIVFQDNGKGIQPEFLKELHERHFRVLDEKSHDISGYGLGLNIAYKLAQLCNALISIQSTKEKGTEVTLTIDSFTD